MNLNHLGKNHFFRMGGQRKKIVKRTVTNTSEKRNIITKISDNKKEDNIKILHLILFSEFEYYNKMKDITSQYYKNINSNIKSIYYTYRKSNTNEFELEDDVLYIKGNESYVPGILIKTIKALLYFKNEINTYDYVVRSNISSVINMKLLMQKLTIKPIVYGGPHLCLSWLDEKCGIKNNEFFNTTYASGTCIIMNKKIVKSILVNMQKIRYDIIDDVAIGIFIKQFHPNISFTPFVENEFYTVTQTDNMDTLPYENIIVYRNRCNIQSIINEEDRNKDIENMTSIVANILNNNFNKNIMISSYRLGDLVFDMLGENEKNEILIEHPNSIGSKYILEKRNNTSCDNIDLITKIIMESIEQNLHFLPKNITDSTLIHLRLGDVISGNELHEKSKRPLEVDYIKSLVSNDTNPKYVIGKCFFAKTSSTNYEECIDKSNEYLHNVINELQTEYFNSGNADIDLCCGVKSKLFIQGRGFFSKLIVEIRKKLNLSSIETSTHD